MKNKIFLAFSNREMKKKEKKDKKIFLSPPSIERSLTHAHTRH